MSEVPLYTNKLAVWASFFFEKLENRPHTLTSFRFQQKLVLVRLAGRFSLATLPLVVLGHVIYRGTSPIRNSAPLGPYSRTMPRSLWWSWGGGLYLMSEAPLYPEAGLSRNP